jgi:hypothetical protein
MKFKNLRSKLNEANSLRNEVIPAPMLVLRRRGIRIFPDGRHVALYTNDKYNLVFTVPYGGSASAGNSDMGTPLVGVPNG